MPTFIKAGYWEQLKRGFKGYLELDLLVKTVIGNDIFSALQEANSPSVTNPIATLADVGGGGGGIISVTYDELVDLISTSSLSEGSLYSISDFATTYWMLASDGAECNNGVPIIGTTEPIVVTATSNNTLAKEAYSPTYPNDILWYDWDPANYAIDFSFFGGGDLPDWKGVITYREDTIYNNSCGYDFRNVKFRRWEVTADDWVSEQSYVSGDFVKFTDQNGSYIYKCIINCSDATFMSTNWVKVFNLSTSIYWAANSTADWIGATIVSESYSDFYTFLLDNNTVHNNTLDVYQDDALSHIGTRLSNIVLMGAGNHSNKFGVGCYFITFGYANNSNTIGVNNNEIILCQGNFGNSFGFSNSTAVLCDSNYMNTFSMYSVWNFLSDMNGFNTFGDGTANNDLGYANSYNTFGIGNTYNVLQSSTYNIINNYNSYNRFISSSYNTMEYGNNHIIFGSGCNGNSFNNENSYITFGAGVSYNSFGNTNSNHDFSTFSPQTMRFNEFKNEIDGTGIDYTSCTHLVSSYQTIVFLRSDGEARLSYYDGSDALTVVNINA